jgi:hypothetical protein
MLEEGPGLDPPPGTVFLPDGKCFRQTRIVERLYCDGIAPWLK